jgi:hypothetical protein
MAQTVADDSSYRSSINQQGQKPPLTAAQSRASHAQKAGLGPASGGVPRGVKRKEAVLAIRGTKTIQDLVTDIRAAPQEFPPPAEDIAGALNGECHIDNTHKPFNATTKKTSHTTKGAVPNSDSENESPSNSTKHWEWLNVAHSSTYACGGFSRAAMHVLREAGPSLAALYREGYEITIVGHSLGE